MDLIPGFLLYQSLLYQGYYIYIYIYIERESESETDRLTDRYRQIQR